MNWTWAIGAALLGVAALSVYSAFQSPTFVTGLLGAMVVAACKAILPVIEKRMTPEKEKAWRHDEAAGRGDEYLRKRYGGLKE